MTPEELIDKVAKALFDYEWETAVRPPKWSRQDAQTRKYWMGAADAAIKVTVEACVRAAEHKATSFPRDIIWTIKALSPRTHTG